MYIHNGFNHQAIIGKKQRDLPPAMYVYTCTYTMVLTTRPPLTPLNDDAPFNSEVLSSTLFVVCRFSILVVLYLRESHLVFTQCSYLDVRLSSLPCSAMY